MKTETQIAKNNIKIYNKHDTNQDYTICREHEKSCQRFFIFIRNLDKCKIKGNMFILNDKIKDLQQAIKLYEKAGI